MKKLGVVLFSAVSLSFAQDAPKPKVFVTDSQSWETRAAGGGTNGTWAAAATGGARPQTAEIIKTFGERCPSVMVNNIQSKTDYIVLLDHEGGKGYLQHRNKVAVFQRISGDTIVSKSTLSLGGSVQDACNAITSDFQKNGDRLRELAAKESTPSTSGTQAVAENKSKAQSP